MRRDHADKKIPTGQLDQVPVPRDEVPSLADAVRQAEQGGQQPGKAALAR